MLTFLKRMKNQKGKSNVINVLLCSMQILTPVFALAAMTISMAQQSALSMIVKDFVSIGVILGFDNLLANSLPQSIRTNAENINLSGGLVLQKDSNSFRLIFKRAIREYTDIKSVTNEIMNVVVNLWFFTIINFQVIFYNYFAPLIVIIVQMLGYLKNL